MRALIIGGTRAGRALARHMSATGWHVTTSLAKENSFSSVPNGEVHIGGFGGPAGLTQWLLHNGVEVIVDASDPFAERISVSAAEAGRALRIPVLIVREPNWQPQKLDKWERVASLEDAASIVARKFHHILVDLGTANLDAFAQDSDNLYILRGANPAAVHRPARCRRLPVAPGADVAAEKKTLRDNQVDAVVVRETLGEITPVVAAARELGVTVIIQSAPVATKGSYVASSVNEAQRYVDAL